MAEEAPVEFEGDYMKALFIALTFSLSLFATEIQLTEPQVSKVLADNEKQVLSNKAAVDELGRLLAQEEAHAKFRKDQAHAEVERLKAIPEKDPHWCPCERKHLGANCFSPASTPTRKKGIQRAEALWSDAMFKWFRMRGLNSWFNRLSEDAS